MPSLYKFIPNPLATREIKYSVGTGLMLMSYAEAVAGAAREVAPVRTGAYEESIHAEDLAGAAAVVADDEKAVWIEFGTGEPGPTPAFAPLRRGAEAVGIVLTADRPITSGL